MRWRALPLAGWSSERDVGSFTRSQFEANFRWQAQGQSPGLAVAVKRHLETSLEEGVFEALESLALEPAMHKRTRLKYNISVEDREQPNVSYKLACVVEGGGIKLLRVSGVAKPPSLWVRTTSLQPGVCRSPGGGPGIPRGPVRGERGPAWSVAAHWTGTPPLLFTLPLLPPRVLLG